MRVDDYGSLVDRVLAGEITSEEAYTEFDRLIDDVHAGRVSTDWPTVLGLTDEEATVVLHGRPWAEIAEIRRARAAEVRMERDEET
jgi:hypothetical protein